MNLLIALAVFVALGFLLGVLLAVASRVFAVKTDERIPRVLDCLPGANCGGCGYAGCAAMAEAIVKGDAKPGGCPVSDGEAKNKIASIMGVEASGSVRMRAQVLCSGTKDLAKKKFLYEGVADCIAATKLGGGDKLCPNGCIGLGTCAAVCPFEAIEIHNGVAVVNYHKCQACGLCADACPKHLIELIPFDSRVWVGCKSVDKGAVTRQYCDVGCISCKKCEKTCQHGAITVTDFVAKIDYEKCVQCGDCVAACPRKIIWSDQKQGQGASIRVGEADVQAE